MVGRINTAGQGDTSPKPQNILNIDINKLNKKPERYRQTVQLGIAQELSRLLKSDKLSEERKKHVEGILNEFLRESVRKECEVEISKLKAKDFDGKIGITTKEAHGLLVKIAREILENQKVKQTAQGSDKYEPTVIEIAQAETPAETPSIFGRAWNTIKSIGSSLWNGFKSLLGFGDSIEKKSSKDHDAIALPVNLAPAPIEEELFQNRKYAEFLMETSAKNGNIFNNLKDKDKVAKATNASTQELFRRLNDKSVNQTKLSNTVKDILSTINSKNPNFVFTDNADTSKVGGATILKNIRIVVIDELPSLNASDTTTQEEHNGQLFVYDKKGENLYATVYVTKDSLN